MSLCFDADLGLVNSQDLMHAYLQKIRQIQQADPNQLQSKEDLLGLNYHGESVHDALLNFDQIKTNNVHDMGPMSDYCQQMAHPWGHAKDESLRKPKLALAAYEVVTVPNLSTTDQDQLATCVAQYLDPDEDFEQQTTNKLQDRYHFDDETVLTAQDLADEVEHDYQDHQDLMEQQFEQSGIGLRTDDPTPVTDTKKQFLQQYQQGLSDALSSQTEVYDENDEQYAWPDVTQQSYGYTLGRTMGQQVLNQLDDYEEDCYQQKVAPMMDDNQPTTFASDVRDDPKLRIMSEHDHQVMQHAVLNDAYRNMKDALTHLDEQNVVDPQQPDGINVTNLASVMQDDQLKQITFEDHNLVGSLMPNVKNHTYQMEDAYQDSLKGEYLPQAMQQLVNHFAERDYDQVLSSSNISSRDKTEIDREHGVEQALIDPERSTSVKTQASMISKINLNAKHDEPDKLESLQVTPKQAKEETNEQQLQHDEDSHKENVTVVKSKKRSKLKVNDGPEM